MKITFSLIIFLTFLILPGVLQAQLLSVSGYVKNALTGETIENVAIYESISGIGTITNRDGYYRLMLNSGKQNLKISRAGYETFTSAFKMDSDTVISVEMILQNLYDNKVAAGNKLKKDSIEAGEKPAMIRKRK